MKYLILAVSWSKVNHIVDTVIHSQNETMALYFRIVRICEKQGTVFDRMEKGMCDLTILVPNVETGIDFTRTKLHLYDKLNDCKKVNKNL